MPSTREVGSKQAGLRAPQAAPPATRPAYFDVLVFRRACSVVLPMGCTYVLMQRTVQSSSWGYSTRATTVPAKWKELMGPGGNPELLS